MGYTPTGPWTSGAPPGIDAGFLDNVEAFIQQLEGDINVTTLNGSTSGTAKLYQVVRGTYKKVIIRLNNFRNGGGSAQTIAIPTPFTDFARFDSWQMAQYQVLASASAITLFYASSIGASGFGASSTTTINASLNVLFVTTAGSVIPFDAISFNGSAGGANTGFLIIEGM